LKTIAGGDAVLAREPADVVAAKRDGKLALIPALEGADGLDGDIDHLYELHRKGVGLVHIVHFRANALELSRHPVIFSHTGVAALHNGEIAI